VLQQEDPEGLPPPSRAGGLQALPWDSAGPEPGRRRSVSRGRTGGSGGGAGVVGEGKRAIKSVTMNLAGQSVMGITPAYKINYIRWDIQLLVHDVPREFLYCLPDVIFFQDCIQEEDLTQVLEKVSGNKYKLHLQVGAMNRHADHDAEPAGRW
jgi:hypothetical protein